MEEEYEIEIGKGTRKRVKSGDVFYYKLSGTDMYFYGKVIYRDIDGTKYFFVNKSMVVYLYKTYTNGLNENIILNTNDIYAVIFTYTKGWTKGFFHTFRHDEVTEEELSYDCGFHDDFKLKFINKSQIKDYDSYCYIEAYPDGSYGAAPYVDWNCKELNRVPKHNFGDYIFTPCEHCAVIANRILKGEDFLIV